MDDERHRWINPETTAVSLGTAGEYLVASRLMRWGYEVSLAPQDCTYDIIIGHASCPRLLAAQVKTTRRPNKPQKTRSRRYYKWRTFKGRSGGGVTPKNRYVAGDADLFFLVALDIERFDVMETRDPMPVSTNRTPKSMELNDEYGKFITLWDKITKTP